MSLIIPFFIYFCKGAFLFLMVSKFLILVTIWWTVVAPVAPTADWLRFFLVSEPRSQKRFFSLGFLSLRMFHVILVVTIMLGVHRGMIAEFLVQIRFFGP